MTGPTIQARLGDVVKDCSGEVGAAVLLVLAKDVELAVLVDIAGCLIIVVVTVVETEATLPFGIVTKVFVVMVWTVSMDGSGIHMPRDDACFRYDDLTDSSDAELTVTADITFGDTP